MYVYIYIHTPKHLSHFNVFVSKEAFKGEWEEQDEHNYYSIVISRAKTIA